MAERFLLDSNICIYLLKDLSPALTARVRGQAIGSLVVSAITLAEIGIGARAEEAPALRRFLEEVAVAPFDAAAAATYAAIPFRRGSFDRLIAAHALALDVPLVTNNEADFADVPGLRVENWTL